MEIKRDPKNMPVRKHFNNTFGSLLNDALYELQKRQERHAEEEVLFTTRGSIEYVADYLLNNLPEHEKNPTEEGGEDQEENI